MSSSPVITSVMKTLQHNCATLGADVVAEEDPETGLAFFRGIPYASVSKRWTQSKTQDSLPPVFDATKFGPKCPQPPHVHVITVSSDAAAGAVEVDEFTCLNLNITVPSHALPKAERTDVVPLLPVLVWVHGGAFKNGRNSDPRYEPKILSSLASQAGKPFVIVQINYRLGVFGFAASSDFAVEYKAGAADSSTTPGASDYFGNFGIIDQKHAFEWVQKHIQDFGGDPSNVTAAGVSAGSASVHIHILSGNPLFDRAILESGSAPMMGPLPLQYCEATWLKFCKASGVEGSETRLEKLRLLSVEDVINYGGKATWAPLGDGKLLPKTWRLGDPHPTSRCKDIIIGTTQVEGIIFDGVSRLLPQKYLHSKILTAFSPTDAELFCKYFGFNPLEEQTLEAYRDAIRLFTSVVIFHYPALRIAETYNGNSYLYNFEEKSHFDGPSYGMSVHGQCAVFLFGNGREALPESAQKVSLAISKAWTDFVYGKVPWERYTEKERFMRFGPEGESGLKTIGDDDTRNYEYLDWLRVHFDEAAGLMFSLLG